MFPCCHLFCSYCTSQLQIRNLPCPVCRCPPEGGGGDSQMRLQGHSDGVASFLSNAIESVRVSDRGSASRMDVDDEDDEDDDLIAHALGIASSMMLPHDQRYTVLGGGRLVSTPPRRHRPSVPPPPMPTPVARLAHSDVLESASALFQSLDSVSPEDFRRRLGSIDRSQL